MNEHQINRRQSVFSGEWAVDAADREGAVLVKRSSVAGRPPQRRQRVLLVASAGGHWIELARLTEAFADADCRFISTAQGMTSPIDGAEVMTIPDFSRHSMLVGLAGLVRLYREIRRFDPDVVFSTGAAPGAAAIMLGKLRGARTIWVDSLANYDGLSLSARFVHPFSDRMVTQWPHLVSARKGIECWGRIL
jgi:UDP-N-acetylglucosamine:LPS N-acetylglucosamine transferase